MNILTTLTSYKAKKALLEEIEKEIETMKNDIIQYMNGKDELICGQYKVTNKDCTRNGIDEKTLKIKYPAIAKELEKTTTYKRFIVK